MCSAGGEDRLEEVFNVEVATVSQLAMGCVTCHTCHGCVTDFRPMEVTHVTSPGHVTKLGKVL